MGLNIVDINFFIQSLQTFFFIFRHAFSRFLTFYIFLNVFYIYGEHNGVSFLRDNLTTVKNSR